MFTSTCITVLDGDTFDVLDGTRIRLANVCAPELNTWQGFIAKSQLENLVLNQMVTCYECGVSYGRTVADVWVGAVYVNDRMREMGYTCL